MFSDLLPEWFMYSTNTFFPKVKPANQSPFSKDVDAEDLISLKRNLMLWMKLLDYILYFVCLQASMIDNVTCPWKYFHMGNHWTMARSKYFSEEVQFIQVILQKLQSSKALIDHS